MDTKVTIMMINCGETYLRVLKEMIIQNRLASNITKLEVMANQNICKNLYSPKNTTENCKNIYPESMSDFI